MRATLFAPVLAVGLWLAGPTKGPAQPLTFSTVAGSGSTGSTDAVGSEASFYWPRGAAADSAGNVYVADTQNATIRMVSPAGAVSTLAGSAGAYGSMDGTGTNAQFHGPQGVAMNVLGTVYVADSVNSTIRQITADGIVSTLAGSVGMNGSADGVGTNAQFYGPQGVAVDSAGNIYVADTWNHTIRKITPAGLVSTLAGLAGEFGGSDGTGSNIGTNTARFHCPAGLAVDIGGDLYVADCFNHTIRKVTAAGVVSTLAGLAGVWGSEDGTNSGARFYRPAGVAVDIATNIYVLDAGNHTIRKVSPDGTNWVVSTVAGQAGASGSTDGPGSTARFNHPAGLALDSAGSVYVVDTGNNTLRQGALIGTGPPVITTQPQDQTLGLGATVTLGVIAGGAAPLSYQWTLYGTNIPLATTASYTRLNVQPEDAGPYAVAISNSLGTATSSNALLTVIAPPSITTQPLSQIAAQGVSVTFAVAASGTPPLSTQWRFNGSPLPGATASSYTRANVQLADTGTYSAVVSNLAGTATSSNAVLTVVAPPTITTQPQTQVANQGNSISLTVAASGTPPLSYQWRRYGTNLPGATGTSLALVSVSTNDTGPYTAVVTNAYGTTTSAVAMVMVNSVFQAGGLSSLWKLAPGSRPYLTINSLPYERGMAYNPANSHLLVVSRITPSVYVLDAATGADLHELSVTGVSGGTYPLLMIGVADDGVVYAGNLTTASSTTSFSLYRWANDSSATVPTLAYTGNPTPGNSQRYGDTLDVRGAGTNTQVIIGSRSSTNAVMLTTTDGTNFTTRNVLVADAATSSFGLGLAFGTSDSFWGKSTSVALRQVSYDLAAGTGYTANIYANPTFPNSVGPIGVSTQLNVLAAINVGSDNHLRLYDLTPTLSNGAPALVATNAFASNNDASGTGTGAVDFGGTTVYALCANNGLMALQIVPSQLSAPQPAHFDRISLLPNGSVQLDMSGTPGTSYVLEFTSDWLGWTDLATLSGPNGLFQFTDPAATSGQRFYRLRVGP